MLVSNHQPVEQPKVLPLNSGDDSKLSASGLAANTQKVFDVGRLAQLVADGEVPFPRDLDDSTQRTLVLRVAHLRRGRLLRFIARVIARDIFDSRGTIEEQS